jgi:4-oxalocrotonate tautomerase
MPFVRLEMLTGRSQAVKAALVRDLTEVVARHAGSDPAHIQVLIVEHAPQNWALAGQMLSQSREAGHDG